MAPMVLLAIYLILAVVGVIASYWAQLLMICIGLATFVKITGIVKD